MTVQIRHDFQAFTLVAQVDNHAGELTLSYDAGSDRTALMMDTDGDGEANGLIWLTGNQSGFTHFAL